MDNENLQDQELSSQPPKQDEENVVSVWYGSGNGKFFRRRYFDGFTQYETLEADGKKVLHNVYVGYWYTQKLDRAARIRHRAAYILLFLIAAALTLIGCTRSIAANMPPYSGLFAFAGLLGCGWMAVSVFNEFTVPEKRTIGDYRASSLGLKRSGLMVTIACGLLAVTTLVFTCIGSEKTGLHLLAFGCELVAAACGMAVRVLESKVPYDKKLSELAGKYRM